MPEPKKNYVALISAAIKIQKVFRGYMHRKKNASLMTQLADMSESIHFAGQKKLDAAKAKKASEDKEKAEAAKKKSKSQNREEMLKKKEA